jgi:hypothetical protein
MTDETPIDEEDGDEGYERLKRELWAHGVPAAYKALLAVAEDPKAPAPARATAGGHLFRAAGVFARADKEEVDNESPDHTSLADLEKELAQIRARNAALQRKYDSKSVFD